MIWSFDIHHFANPRMLYLLFLLVPVVGIYVYRVLRGGASVTISSIAGVEKARKTFRYYLRHLPFVLRIASCALIIAALARPQNTEHGITTTTEGIDIVIAIDVSGSMLARDFRPDRMTAAKETAAKFITDRVSDRIGIVVFAGESFTQSPLTTDKRTLLNLLAEVRSGIIEDGTAIGNGLATAVNRLRESDAESKVVILLTDGVNNRGQIAPLTAAEIAKTYGIRVYTIGVGSRGTAMTPGYDRWGRIRYMPAPVEIDEDILREISAMTGGEYFRATDNTSLAEVYEKINELERSKIETNEFRLYHEMFQIFVLLALILLVLEFVIRRFGIRRIP